MAWQLLSTINSSHASGLHKPWFWGKQALAMKQRPSWKSNCMPSPSTWHCLESSCKLAAFFSLYQRPVTFAKSRIISSSPRRSRGDRRRTMANGRTSTGARRNRLNENSGLWGSMVQEAGKKSPPPTIDPSANTASLSRASKLGSSNHAHNITYNK